MECEEVAKRIADQSPTAAARALLDSEDLEAGCEAGSALLEKALQQPQLLSSMLASVPRLGVAASSEAQGESSLEGARQMERRARQEAERALLKSMVTKVEADPVSSEFQKLAARASECTV